MDEENKTDETSQKIVINEKDAEAILKFHEFFNIPMVPGLEEAVKEFIASPTFENQQKVKLFVCKDIFENPHEGFQDPMWDIPKENAKNISFELEFDKNVKEVLGQ